jgi:hypothetical protein
VPQERPDDAEIPITVQQPATAAATTDEDKRAAGEDKRAAGEDKRAAGGEKRAAGDNLSHGSSERTEKPDVTRFSFFEKNFGGEEIVISVKTSDSDDGFEEDLDEPKAQEEESQSRDDSKSSYRMPTF